MADLRPIYGHRRLSARANCSPLNSSSYGISGENRLVPNPPPPPPLRAYFWIFKLKQRTRAHRSEGPDDMTLLGDFEWVSEAPATYRAPTCFVSPLPAPWPDFLVVIISCMKHTLMNYVVLEKWSPPFMILPHSCNFHDLWILPRPLIYYKLDRSSKALVKVVSLNSMQLELNVIFIFGLYINLSIQY